MAEKIQRDLPYFLTRLDAMRTEREVRMREREICDQQYEAPIIEDPITGKININNPLESNLIEMEL